MVVGITTQRCDVQASDVDSTACTEAPSCLSRELRLPRRPMLCLPNSRFNHPASGGPKHTPAGRGAKHLPAGGGANSFNPDGSNAEPGIFCLMDHE